MEKKDFRLASMPSAMCHVAIKRYGETCEEQAISVELWSYYTHVLTIDYHADDQSFELHASGTYTRTTARHIIRFTSEFLGENLYHEIKSVCSKSDEEFPLVLALDCTNNKTVEQAFFKALERYNKYGKRFHDYTKSETERFNAHRWASDCMKYYRANRDAYDHFNKSSLIKGELCTPKERDILFRYIADECFDTVHVKKTETYTFFGARFPDENAQVIVYKEGGCLR